MGVYMTPQDKYINSLYNKAYPDGVELNDPYYLKKTKASLILFLENLHTAKTPYVKEAKNYYQHRLDNFYNPTALLKEELRASGRSYVSIIDSLERLLSSAPEDPEGLRALLEHYKHSETLRIQFIDWKKQTKRANTHNKKERLKWNIYQVIMKRS